jgi:aspartyl-tRNA(Asn)/glutamyl-tRNA(Gln) amidotransferase subunit C
MISKEEVLKIAKLARLELSEKEVGRMQKDLSSILDYFDILKKAPKVAKVARAIQRENVLRRDEAKEKRSTMAGDLIQAAPDKKDGYIKVKQIL